MVDASTDPDYCNTYDEVSRDKNSSPDIDAVVEAERRYFMSRVDDIILRLIFHQVCILSDTLPNETCIHFHGLLRVRLRPSLS
jgi:hypothetical protein